ncbi:MAG: MBL fold metallo-hydrolase [bacterium]|nr:MBL fold metallo-hydrolase [bacterium]
MQATPTFYERLLRQPAPAARSPRPSAAVVPWRRDSEGRIEVYWVRRSPALRFMGGWHAFPGGGLERDDAAVGVAVAPVGVTDSTFTSPDPGIDNEQADLHGPDLPPGLAVCAIRELFEETGLLLAQELLADEPDAPAVDLASDRQRLLDGAVPFGELVATNGWALTAAPLVFAGRWLTPPLAPMRFDNRFFLLEWSREQTPQPDLMGSELDHGEWIRPEYALERWLSGEVLTAPPILHILRVLAEEGPVDGLPRLRDPSEASLGPLRRVEFRPGVILLPLLTPTLPPATHTNAYVLGRRDAVLVDPATPIPSEIERLRSALAALHEQGRRITAIWLTHHHPDHIGAVDAMRRDLQVPVCAHPLAKEALARRGIRIDRELRDGQRVDLGDGSPFPVRIVHTPGHTRGHLCFFDETYRTLIAGDLVSTLSTIVIHPPEGEMDAYLDSLDRAVDLEPRLLLPAHGPPARTAVRVLEQLKKHRLEREDQVLALWQAGYRDAARMTAEIYADVPAQIHQVAERQVEAHLEHLRGLGKI